MIVTMDGLKKVSYRLHTCRATKATPMEIYRQKLSELILILVTLFFTVLHDSKKCTLLKFWSYFLNALYCSGKRPRNPTPRTGVHTTIAASSTTPALVFQLSLTNISYFKLFLNRLKNQWIFCDQYIATFILLCVLFFLLLCVFLLSLRESPFSSQLPLILTSLLSYLPSYCFVSLYCLIFEMAVRKFSLWTIWLWGIALVRRL
jgi:hypothetical protein